MPSQDDRKTAARKAGAKKDKSKKSVAERAMEAVTAAASLVPMGDDESERRLRALADNRIAIEGVEPEIDGGRFAAKTMCRRGLSGRGRHLQRWPRHHRGRASHPQARRKRVVRDADGVRGERPLDRRDPLHRDRPARIHADRLARPVRDVAQRCRQEGRGRPERVARNRGRPPPRRIRGRAPGRRSCSRRAAKSAAALRGGRRAGQAGAADVGRNRNADEARRPAHQPQPLRARA